MTRRVKCGKYAPYFSGATNQSSLVYICVSMLFKVKTGALNFELQTNICCAICTIKYIYHIKIVTLKLLVLTIFT